MGDRGRRGDGPGIRSDRGWRGDGPRAGRSDGGDRGPRVIDRSDGGDRGRVERRGDRGPIIRDGRRWSGADIRRHGRRYAWGPGITFYFYDGYYYGDCDWLRRRAVATGSRYWWRRYRLCRAYDW